jgi:hypothetical protein
MTNEIPTKDLTETAIDIDLDGILDEEAVKSASIVNSNNYPKAMIGILLKTGGSSPEDGSCFIVYLYRRMTNVQDDGLGASAGAATPYNTEVLGTIRITDDTATFFSKIFMTEHLGVLGPEWGIIVKNMTGATNDDSTPTVQGAWYRYLVPELQDPP